MKLKRLFIKQYKNLIDFDIDFQTGNGLSILVGNNGSGKSNVLEALSGIFANAYAAQRTHGAGRSPLGGDPGRAGYRSHPCHL